MVGDENENIHIEVVVALTSMMVVASRIDQKNFHFCLVDLDLFKLSSRMNQFLDFLET